MKPTEEKPVTKKEPPPKEFKNYEPFDEDYSMDAEEEQPSSMAQEACDDFEPEEESSSKAKKGK